MHFLPCYEEFVKVLLDIDPEKAMKMECASETGQQAVLKFEPLQLKPLGSTRVRLPFGLRLF